jgi:signal recognition particle receptor subunit beta
MISFFTEMSDVPYVVAANKVESDDEDGLEQVRQRLELARTRR